MNMKRTVALAIGISLATMAFAEETGTPLPNLGEIKQIDVATYPFIWVGRISRNGAATLAPEGSSVTGLAYVSPRGLSP